MENQLGVVADFEGSPLRNERPKSIMVSEDGAMDDIDESGRITKVLMPNERQIKGVFDDGSKMIGDYKIEKTLGQGTFGKVKQGFHIYTGQKVAIKILDKWKIDDINDIERVAREIHILKIVKHPHIIELYEIIET